jgi:hypothetical protein
MEVHQTNQTQILETKTQLIETAKNGIQWDSEVNFVPAHTHNGNVAGYATEAVGADGKTEVLGRVGENYLLLHNKELLDEVEYWIGMNSDPVRIFWDGSRFAAVYEFDTQSPSFDASGNQRDLKLSLLVKNSYNGAWKAEVSLMILDAFCMNGMVLGKRFGTVKFRHTKRDQSDWCWTNDLANIGPMVQQAAQNQLPEFANHISKLAEKEVKRWHLRALFGSASETKIGNAVAGTILQRWVDHEESSLHGLLSAGTNVLWHNDAKSFTSRSFDMNEAYVNAFMELA